MRENKDKVLRNGREIKIRLYEFGVDGDRNDMGLNDINRGNIDIDGNDNDKNRIDVNMLKMKVGEKYIRMYVYRN